MDGPSLSPTMKAAIDACELAERNQGSLVRVTMTSLEQTDVIMWISNYLANKHLLDEGKTIARSLKCEGNATVELLNGSGIEFVLKTYDRREKAPDATR